MRSSFLRLMLISMPNFSLPRLTIFCLDIFSKSACVIASTVVVFLLFGFTITGSTVTVVSLFRTRSFAVRTNVSLTTTSSLCNPSTFLILSNNPIIISFNLYLKLVLHLHSFCLDPILG